jgi:hypothetical protein
MSVRSRVENAVKALRAEAIVPISSPSSDPDEHLWEPFGLRNHLSRRRNLPALTQQQMINSAHYLYKGNPLAKRIIELMAEFVIGDGVTYVTDNDRVRQILDSHWTDPTNNWSILQHRRVEDWGLVGELLIPVFVNRVNGHVTLGNIDTELIDRVIEDPENTMKPYAVLLKKFRGEKQRRLYKVIDVANVALGGDASGRLIGLPENDKEIKEWGFKWKKGDVVRGKELPGMSRATGEWAGAAFFFTLNNPLTANRGWSDLLNNLDFIDAHDQYLFASVEKAIESAKWIRDVELKGMNEQQQREWLQAQEPVKPGSVFTHNENVTQQMMTPDLRLEDSAALSTQLKNHALAGSGFPPIWFGESLVSRASAAEMTEPTFKHVRRRQRLTAFMMGTILRFAVDQAALFGRLKLDGRQGDVMQRQSESFYLKMPDVSAKDQRMLSIALNNISSALDKAVESEFLDRGEAKRLFRQYLDMSGLDMGKHEIQASGVVEQGEEFSVDRVFTQAREASDIEQRDLSGQAYFVFLGREAKEEIDPSSTNGLVVKSDGKDVTDPASLTSSSP